MTVRRDDLLALAEAARLHPVWKGARDVWGTLPPLDSLTGRVTEHEHVCGVGSAPRGEGCHIRRCRCDAFYRWDGRMWRKMGLLSLIRHRRQLATLPDGFADLFADEA